MTTQSCWSNIAASSGLRITGRVSQKELASWERLGEGGFSSVYKAKLKGNDVAVKVLKNLKETKPLLTEGNLLRYFYSWFSEVTQFLSYRRWKILFWFCHQPFVDFITWGRLNLPVIFQGIEILLIINMVVSVVHFSTQSRPEVLENTIILTEKY